MIDREYAHHIQLSADWRIEDENVEGVQSLYRQYNDPQTGIRCTIDIYDATINTVVDHFVKFIAGEYDFDREFVVRRIIEHLSE